MLAMLAKRAKLALANQAKIAERAKLAKQAKLAKIAKLAKLAKMANLAKLVALASFVVLFTSRPAGGQPTSQRATADKILEDRGATLDTGPAPTRSRAPMTWGLLIL